MSQYYLGTQKVQHQEFTVGQVLYCSIVQKGGTTGNVKCHLRLAKHGITYSLAQPFATLYLLWQK